MSNLPPAAAPPDEGVRHYTFLCLTALGAMTLALFLRGLDVLSLLPGLMGALALALRLRTGAVLGVLLFIVWLLAAQQRLIVDPHLVLYQIARIGYLLGLPTDFIRPPSPLRPHDFFGVADILLCASTLAFFAGYYRLLSVATHIFPADPRRRKSVSARGRPSHALQERRSSTLVMGHEIGMLVAAIPIWVALAWLCWRWLEPKHTMDLDIDDRWWRLMVLVWLLGFLFLLASGLVRYVAQGHLRPEEAALYLQDSLWRETSREQRRIHRWLVWARRRQRRKEQP